MNVMHFQSTGYDIASLITALEANATANMWAHTRTDTGIVDYTLTPLDGFGASVVQATGLPAKWKGTQALADTVPQASPILKLTTGGRGRSTRGRVYLPFPQETALNSSILEATIRTSMQTAWTAFRNAMDTANKDWVVASYKLASSALVTNVFVEQLLATQRRRQPRPS